MAASRGRPDARAMRRAPVMSRPDTPAICTPLARRRVASAVPTLPVPMKPSGPGRTVPARSGGRFGNTTAIKNLPFQRHGSLEGDKNSTAHAAPYKLVRHLGPAKDPSGVPHYTTGARGRAVARITFSGFEC